MNTLATEIADLTHWVDTLERLEPPATPECLDFAMLIATEIEHLHHTIDTLSAQYERDVAHAG